MQTSGAARREIAKSYFGFDVIARSEATKQSILSLRGKMDCFGGACHRARIRATRWLAMTIRPFENEVGVCAKRSLRSLLETHPSCPDLIRASINLRKKVLSKKDGSPGQAR